MHQYGFPESRLKPANEETASSERDETVADGEMTLPEEFPETAVRLEQNEFDVTYDAGDQVLRVEKHGVEHTIEHDGTVRGESGMKQRVTVVVNRFL